MSKKKLHSFDFQQFVKVEKTLKKKVFGVKKLNFLFRVVHLIIEIFQIQVVYCFWYFSICSFYHRFLSQVIIYVYFNFIFVSFLLCTFEHLLFLEKYQYIYIQYMTLTNHSTFCRSYEIKFLLLLRYFKNKINYVFSTRQRWYRAQRPTLTSAWSSPTREGVTYPWTTSWSPSTPRYCPLSVVQ